MIRIFLTSTVILICAALDFPTLDAWRRTHYYGWTSPAMTDHWQRLFKERTPHAAKNVLSEWVRLDPQRAGKLFAFLLVLSLLGNILLLIVHKIRG